MKETILISLITSDFLVLGVLIICFFNLHYGEIKLLKNIQKYYTNSMIVKCVSIDEKGMNRNYVNRVEGYGGNLRVHYDVIRPTFRGVVNGKTHTFVRTKDIMQPKCKVGEEYTIYLRNIQDINSHDFYEKQEINDMRNNIRKVVKKYTFGGFVCIGILILILAMFYM